MDTFINLLIDNYIWLIAISIFLIFALIGYFTNMDLSKIGTYLFMALIGIILCSIVLCILFIYNKKLSKYLIIIINLILVFLIGKYYISDIISFKFSNPINNMYFYFFNSFIFIVVITIQVIFNLLVTYDYILKAAGY